MAYKTPLFDAHVAMSAKMTVFGGWDMPLHYGSQIEEHHRVRHDAGAFDVSHLGRLDIYGTEAQDFLRYLLANDVAPLYPGKALYTCMLNEDGGILDDLIVYDRGENSYRLAISAPTRDTNLAWIQDHSRHFNIILRVRDDLAMIAVQGPQAAERLGRVIDPEITAMVSGLAPFHHLEQGELFISHTGYTGEDGVEVTLPNARATEFWNALLDAGVWPCGLGARDTLRLEAGMNLYGRDMNETTSPLVCGLGWTVAWDAAGRHFIGRAALKRQRREGVRQTQAGLILMERGVLRDQQRIIAPSGATGQVTSGTFSPTLGRSIALARVPVDIGARCQVDIRHRYCSARVVKPPFVRHGRSLIALPSH